MSDNKSLLHLSFFQTPYRKKDRESWCISNFKRIGTQIGLVGFFPGHMYLFTKLWRRNISPVHSFSTPTKVLRDIATLSSSSWRTLFDEFILCNVQLFEVNFQVISIFIIKMSIVYQKSNLYFQTDWKRDMAGFF